MSKKRPPMRSLLSRNMILHHIKEGNILITSFNPENVRTNSYDIRLGEYFFQERPFRASDRKIFNPFDPNDIKEYWGKPQEAIKAKDWMNKNGPLVNIRADDQIIILGPGETILAHSQEFIGGRTCVSSEMRAKSSMGRIGITVCKCAGWGDVSFFNRWTMEVTNHLIGASVLLVVGMRVAQIIFYQVDPLSEKETYSKIGGQYQTTDDPEKMMREWSPYLMLPKFNRDNY